MLLGATTKERHVIFYFDIAKKVLKKLREVHPYEEPGIDIIPLINEEDLIIKN